MQPSIPIRVNYGAWAVFVGLAVTAAGLYPILWPLENLDLTLFYFKLLDRMRAAGLAEAVSLGNYDYQAIYLLLVKVVDTLSPFDAPIDVIKSVALVGLIPLAWMAYRLARLRSELPVALVAGAGCCLLPTVAANVALWRQVDTLLAAPLIGAVLCGIAGRLPIAFALFGLAVSIKLQAVFMMPFFGYLLLRQRASLWHFAYFAVGFSTAFLASVLAGVAISRGVTVYFMQVGFYKRSSLNAPGLWEILRRIVDIPYNVGVVISLGPAVYHLYHFSVILLCFGKSHIGSQAMFPLSRRSRNSERKIV